MSKQHPTWHPVPALAVTCPPLWARWTFTLPLFARSPFCICPVKTKAREELFTSVPPYSLLVLPKIFPMVVSKQFRNICLCAGFSRFCAEIHCPAHRLLWKPEPVLPDLSRERIQFQVCSCLCQSSCLNCGSKSGQVSCSTVIMGRWETRGHNIASCCVPFFPVLWFQEVQGGNGRSRSTIGLSDLVGVYVKIIIRWLNSQFLWQPFLESHLFSIKTPHFRFLMLIKDVTFYSFRSHLLIPSTDNVFRVKFTEKIEIKKELSSERNEESPSCYEVRDAETVGPWGYDLSPWKCKTFLCNLGKLDSCSDQLSEHFFIPGVLLCDDTVGDRNDRWFKRKSNA